MAISLYDLTVPTYQQTLAGLAGVLDRGLSHFQDNNIDPNAIVEERLFDDMLPFKFQVWAVAHHSIDVIEGLKTGRFGPPSAMGDLDYLGLQKVIADTREALAKLTPEQVNRFEGADIVFEIGNFKLPFTAENFVLSFSLPNFHFHATTAYDLLRLKGVPLGKRDYMGPMRMKG